MNRRPRSRRTNSLSAAAALLLICAGAWAGACAGPSREDPQPSPAVADEAVAAALRELDPPAASDAFAPNLAIAGGNVVATWLERLASLDGEEGPRRHRVRFARLEGDAWGAPSTIAEGDDFFANWADFPGVVGGGDGALYAHWLAKTGSETYAYSIFLARSADGGASWEPLGVLNDDATPTEHGFVSYLPETDGVRAFWLDGRAMAAGGAMALRTAAISEAGPGPAEILDDRVCECCSTGAARTALGATVVYRDRSLGEVRDVSVVRRLAEGWTAPAPLHGDGWKIPGCPVNGPEIDAAGDLAAVAWFTAPGETPQVRLAFSEDGGASFGEPVGIDTEGPVGRVDVVLDAAGDALVSWLATDGEGGEVRIRRIGRDGSAGPPLAAAATAASRAAGFPRLVRRGDRLYLAWTEVAGEAPSRVRLLDLPVTAVPARVSS